MKNSMLTLAVLEMILLYVAAGDHWPAVMAVALAFMGLGIAQAKQQARRPQQDPRECQQEIR